MAEIVQIMVIVNFFCLVFCAKAMSCQICIYVTKYSSICEILIPIFNFLSLND